jgi:hypothetical protein
MPECAPSLRSSALGIITPADQLAWPADVAHTGHQGWLSVCLAGWLAGVAITGHQK